MSERAQLMPRKTPRQRDLIDYPIAIARTRSRAKKLELLDEFHAKHGDLPRELLDAFGRSEWSRGWDDGVRDATVGG